MQKFKQIVLTTALFTSVCSSAHAFNDGRRGFMFGAGGGLHSTDFESSRADFADSSKTENGLQSRLTVGFGINERFTVYGVYDLQVDDDAVYGLLGPGATYYFRSAGPSAYIFGGAGIGALSFVDEVEGGPNDGDDYEPATGGGVMFGGGFAFTQGFHLDTSLMYLDITDDENFISDRDFEITSLRVTASYTWF